MGSEKKVLIRPWLNWVQVALIGAVILTLILNPDLAFRIIQVLGSLLGFFCGVAFKDDFTKQGFKRSKAWAASLGFGIFLALAFQGIVLFAYYLGK